MSNLSKGKLRCNADLGFLLQNSSSLDPRYSEVRLYCLPYNTFYVMTQIICVKCEYVVCRWLIFAIDGRVWRAIKQYKSQRWQLRDRFFFLNLDQQAPCPSLRPVEGSGLRPLADSKNGQGSLPNWQRPEAADRLRLRQHTTGFCSKTCQRCIIPKRTIWQK